MKHSRIWPVRIGSLCLVTLLASFVRHGIALAQQATPSPVQASVIVEWTTESEVNLAGFNLYRSADPQGPYVNVNDALIPASPDPVTGGTYLYTDTGLTAGVTYYYKLEDVELDGSSTMQGPIEVLAGAESGASPFQVSSIGVALLVGLLVIIALVIVLVWRSTGRGPFRPQLSPAVEGQAIAIDSALSESSYEKLPVSERAVVEIDSPRSID